MNRIGMRPVHPGEVLSEEFLTPLGITIEGLARLLNEPEAEVSGVVSQQISVNAGLAKKLSMNLNTTPEFWLNLQSTYYLRSAQIGRE